MSATIPLVESEGSQDSELTLLRTAQEQAVAALFSKYRDRLEQMVHVRLDQRLIGRVDPADVLQEAYIEIARRVESYLASPTVSFFVWVRQITWQTLIDVQRRHLGQKRYVGKEVSLHGRHQGMTSSTLLARQLVSQLTSPSQAAIRKERVSALRDTIDGLDETDREILVLRHFEHLTNSEAAEVLGLKKTAASNRYTRALKRLRVKLIDDSDE